ncbi:MAG: outer membrane beta-barrel protein, partial [Bacteroidota bacterium]
MSFSQVRVSGKIVEKGTNYPLEYASITFINPVEDKVINGGVTDVNGHFSVEIDKATYKIKFEYLSYKSVIITRDILSAINLGIIELELDVETLEQVEIVAERTSVEIKLDKKIYNVGKDLTVRGGTVSDVLDNIPSVSVDVEGVVALRGNEDVRILINGKPSGLIGLNNSDALRQLPADAIERVEVITAPSGRYDAEGTAGILNIILRRSKLLGFNGASTINIGYPERYGLSGNLNYRIGNFNFFNTSSILSRFNPGNAFTNTKFDSGFIQMEDREFEREQHSINTSVGFEWFFNESTTIMPSLQYRNSDGDNQTTNTINIFNSNGDLTSNTLRFDPEFSDDRTLQYGVDLDKYFGENPDHKFTFSFQIEDSEDLEKSLIIDTGRTNEDVTTDEKQDRLFFQADYVLPISEKSQIELGYQGRFLTLDTDYVVLEEDEETGDFIINEDLSNNLIYKEYVNAAYAQFGSKIKESFSYLIGLRMENSDITINQTTIGAFDTKLYTDLFPSLNLAFEFSEDQNVTLGFNRRIRRPRARLINPFPSRNS